MAFDLYLDGERTFIQPNEEGIFYLINEEEYPQLARIWDQYYKSPRITSAEANDLVHELICLREKLIVDESQAYLRGVIDRLLPFLSRAYRSNMGIRTCSD